MGIVISSHMLYAWSKGALNYCFRWEKLKVEALIFHKNITETFALQTNVTLF